MNKRDFKIIALAALITVILVGIETFWWLKFTGGSG